MGQELQAALSRLSQWVQGDRLTLITVLDIMYPGKALAQLAARVGLSYPGHRIGTVPRTELLDAVSDILARDPEERTRVLTRLLEAVEAERNALAGMSPKAVRRWLMTTSDESMGMRRLIAAVADPRESVSQVAEKWWARELGSVRQEAARAPGLGEAPLLDTLLDTVTEPVDRATQVLEQVGRQLRDVGRSLEQAAQRTDQTLGKHTTRVSQQVESVTGELARMRSWMGEQHAGLRRTLDDLAGAVRSLESRMDRFETALHELVARVAAVAMTLDRGQLARARRELARLRSGRRRVGVFLDVANLYVSAREAHAARISYRGLLERAAQLGEVILARAYVSESQDPARHQGLETVLREAGYRVHLLALRRYPDGRVKANWDLGMATDVMRSIADLDVVVLGTGDGDFAELVRWLREEGLQVHVAGVTEHTAQELIAASDGWIPLTGDLLIPETQRT